ncbi:SusC/RagA family TonB-linked outer membrane protein [Pontimicrobium aquaticum]|uniref:SusC/RagA family TonB-linked outer membrane protein n=1 Tax=Pontimicrobium aquaticum TaxID=2565367 RepID=A0A4V5LPV4_9FLAO|nr:SusC/RagA family TonB-linked outer membrane protein [Pontimicrobium aquaticum]TJY32829.1 SusC/RagA family TonB-linked outer membrane protein [Pontimicrobium aquaticum]
MKNNYISKGRRLLFYTFCFALTPYFTNTLNAKNVLDLHVSNKFNIQQNEVYGTITDTSGMPIVGVHVFLQGTKHGVVSNIDGQFTIKAQKDDILVFSAIGFISKTVTVNDIGELNIQLLEDVTQLNAVTLNAGYYSVKEKERTGNIAKISGVTIEKQPVINPMAAMQGHMSGVNIVQNTGVPGGGYNIDIRGKNFINGITDPLFIIDGVPFSSQSLGSVDVSGQINGGNISPLNAIDPASIESIEVLKDADATAIYGARAANGVVLITTKRGKVGKTQFKANLSSTIGQVSNFLELMNTEQYLEVRREGITNDGFGPFLDNPAFDFIWPDIKSWDNTRYTNWQKELIGGTAYRNNAHLSVSGGSTQTKFLISGTYQKETTVFPGDANYKKASVHNNINHQSNDNRFKINLSTIYTNEKNLLPRSDFTNLAYTLEPNAPRIYDDEGNLNWEGNTWNNPLASLEEIYQVKINTLITNAGVSYKVFPNLEIKTNLGFNTYDLESYRTLPSVARNPSLGFTPQNYSSITTNNSKRQSWILEPQLNWNKQWDNAKLEILLGSTFQRENTEQFVQKGTGFPNNSLILNLSAAETLEVINDMDSEYSYQAFFGRVNLNWNDKYILNLTGRRDGSSRFGPDRKFGNFGAVGVAWLFSEENIFNDSPILSFGKLRGSFGTTGSDNIGDYKFLDTYNVTGFDYDGTTILEPTGIFNPLFGWEANKKLEAAIELGFFNDRLLLNTSWYQNRSSNQLIGIPLAATTGFPELTGNFDATVENTGFEVDLRTVNIKKKNFKWTTTFNITVPKNKLLKFDGLENSTFANRFVIGKPTTIVKLYNALGVNPDTGKYEFEDYNNDGSISSSDDRQWVEDLAPKFYGGLGNTLSYKNLTFDFFFQFKKQKAFNELAFSATPGFRGNAPVRLLDRWKQPGDSNPIQMATGGLSFGEDTDGLQRRSNAAISDASFIRLRNVSLNYRVPTIDKGLDINVYLQGQNLLTFTKYKGPDPEQPSNTRLPQLRQISLGLQIGF